MARQETGQVVVFGPMKYEVEAAPSQDQGSPMSQNPASNGRLTQVQTSFRFLDLPTAIRLEIYSYFAKGLSFREWLKAEAQLAEAWWNTANSELFDEKVLRTADVRRKDFQAERHAIGTTRRALTLVCQQVSNEFIPVLYCNTTMIVHARQPPLPNGELSSNVIREPGTDHRKLTDLKEVITRGTASTFEQDFLITTSCIRLSSIRFLSYDVSIWNLYLHHPGNFDLRYRLNRDDPKRAGTTNIDMDGLDEFPSALARCRDRLPSLEQVTVLLEGDGDLPRYQLTKEQARQPEVVWQVANEDGNWEEVERTLTQGALGESLVALRGWYVKRTVHLMRTGRPLRLVQYHRNKLYIKRVAIDFRRPQVEAAGKSQEATPGLRVHGDLDESEDSF